MQLLQSVQVFSYCAGIAFGDLRAMPQLFEILEEVPRIDIPRSGIPPAVNLSNFGARGRVEQFEPHRDAAEAHRSLHCQEARDIDERDYLVHIRDHRFHFEHSAAPLRGIPKLPLKARVNGGFDFFDLRGVSECRGLDG